MRGRLASLPADGEPAVIAAPSRSTAHPAASPIARPFLKWAGGKGQLLPALRERVPEGIETYYEPFLGGGALFFALASDPARRPARAVLNDANADLIATYRAVRDDTPALVERLDELQARYLEADTRGRAAVYYEVRDEEPDDPVEVAARFIFLNRTCYNGLYRVNRSGRFNVPHGRYARPRILDCDGLLAASATLQDAELRCGDFEDACAEAGPRDFVYFDPPFEPLSATSNFTAYTGDGFGRAEQERLRRCMDALTARGVPLLLSNSPHRWVTRLYKSGGYDVQRTPARRAINSRGEGRGAIDELLVTNERLRAAR